MPKRILSIDGGGVRGVVAIAFLEALERKLRAEHGREIVLRDHFDLIGGTSTGALLATGLALGRTASEMKALYDELAPKVFRRRLSAVKFLTPLFLGRELQTQIESVTAGRTLDSPDLKPGGLAIVTKRADTGSVWFVTNNPNAKYWNDNPQRRNSQFPLSAVVGASAAAPVYFAPQRLDIFSGGPAGLFVDGAISPHNNPALALLQIATIPAYGYSWPLGADKLEITSVGTGIYRHPLKGGLLARLPLGWAIANLEAIMADCEVQVMTLMQALGRSETPWRINREIGDLSGVSIAPEPLFTFRRYNIRIEAEWLKAELGLSVNEADLRNYRRLDRVASMAPLYDIAQRAAAMQIG